MNKKSDNKGPCCFSPEPEDTQGPTAERGNISIEFATPLKVNRHQKNFFLGVFGAVAHLPFVLNSL